MMLSYFNDRKYFNLIFLLTCTVFRQKSWDSLGIGLDGDSYCENVATHIPFLKKLFLMLTESNSRNVLSKIITNNLEKLLIKIYRFQFFAPNLFALFMDLKSNPLLRLLCDFPKGSSVPFNLLRANVYTYLLLSLWILSFLYFPACSLNFGQPFTPKQ